jgi:hypothetical protein
MTIRYTRGVTVLPSDISAPQHAIVQIGSNITPTIDANNLTNLTNANFGAPFYESLATPVTQGFDSYNIVTVTATTSLTVAPNTLYVIHNPNSGAGIVLTLTLPSSGDVNGDRFAVLFADPRTTNNTISSSVIIKTPTTPTGGQAIRVCYNGICYGTGNALGDSTMGPTLDLGSASGLAINAGALTNGQPLGNFEEGYCVEFIRYNDGIRTGWFERSHFQQFETAGGTTVAGNWANFDNVISTNAAGGSGLRYTLVYDGTDWRWRHTGQDTTAVNFANGTTNTLALPTGYQYMDQLIFLCTVSTAPWTTGYTINLTNFSSLSRDQIHMKPLIFIMGGAAAQQISTTPARAWPGYIVKFTDTTTDATIQQMANFDDNGVSPFTKVNAIGIEDSAYTSTTAHHNEIAGIVIAYDWDNKRWYRIRKLERISG